MNYHLVFDPSSITGIIQIFRNLTKKISNLAHFLILTFNSNNIRIEFGESTLNVEEITHD